MPGFVKLLLGPPGIIFIGVVLSAIGGIWSYTSQNKVQFQLLDKNEKIAELSNKIVGLVSGGDSYCYVDFGTYNPKTDTFLFSIMHEGDYPIYDVKISITDIQKKKELGLDIKNYVDKSPLDYFSDLNKARTHLNYPYLVSFKEGEHTLGISELFELSRFNDNIHRYEIQISARNGLFRQSIRLALFKKNLWVSAKKLIREIDNKIIFERVDHNFPKNEEGKVDWKKKENK